jgi:hypothetical protein
MDCDSIISSLFTRKSNATKWTLGTIQSDSSEWKASNDNWNSASCFGKNINDDLLHVVDAAGLVTSSLLRMFNCSADLPAACMSMRMDNDEMTNDATALTRLEEATAYTEWTKSERDDATVQTGHR